jgi:hypothetical protein
MSLLRVSIPDHAALACYEEYTEDPECYTSGLEEACRAENADVLKRLKPDPSRDNLSELLRRAAF